MKTYKVKLYKNTSIGILGMCRQTFINSLNIEAVGANEAIWESYNIWPHPYGLAKNLDFKDFDPNAWYTREAEEIK